MAVQKSVAVRNAELDVIETTIGTLAVLKFRTGAQPATCATADSGTVVASMTLPSDWMSAAASGAKAQLGTWQDASADSSATIAHWRLYASDGVTCHMQGSATITGGGGDITLDAVAVTAGQVVTITSFTLTEGNA